MITNRDINRQELIFELLYKIDEGISDIYRDFSGLDYLIIERVVEPCPTLLFFVSFSNRYEFVLVDEDINLTADGMRKKHCLTSKHRKKMGGSSYG